MIHMRGIHQAVHRRVNRRGGAALPVQAVIERRDHLVLPVHPGVHVDQGPQPVQPQHREVLGRRVPRSPPDPFTHNNSTGSPVTGSVSVPLADVFPPA